jgi:hypothetical protein
MCPHVSDLSRLLGTEVDAGSRERGGTWAHFTFKFMVNFKDVFPSIKISGTISRGGGRIHTCGVKLLLRVDENLHGPQNNYFKTCSLYTLVM